VAVVEIQGTNGEQVDNGSQSQIAELAKQVSEVKETLHILISQIQMLRSELKNLENKRRKKKRGAFCCCRDSFVTPTFLLCSRRPLNLPHS
jgi:hypothetical protein